MQAILGRVYAQIINGRVWWVFTDVELPEWNGDQIKTIDITGISPQPQIGDVWPTPALDEIKAQRKAAMEAARDVACFADVTALGRQWQADKRSQDLLTGAINLAQAGVPLPSVWRDASNSDMTVTALADLLAIAGAMAAQTQAAYAHSWALKAQIEAAATAAEVAAVVW